MQQKFFVCMALLCLAALPSMNARALENGERELMEMAIQALEAGQAMSAEEAMVMQSGTYGTGNMVGGYGGQAGGILTGSDTSSIGTDATPSTSATDSPSTALESGNSPPSSITTTSAPAATTTAKSAALSAHQSAGLLAAGVMVAMSVFLL